MYICICKGITEEKIRSAIRHTRNPKEVLRKLGVGSDCGTCLLQSVENILREKKYTKTKKAINTK